MESRGRLQSKENFKSFPNRLYFLKIDEVLAEIRASGGDAILLAKFKTLEFSRNLIWRLEMKLRPVNDLF